MNNHIVYLIQEAIDDYYPSEFTSSTGNEVMEVVLVIICFLGILGAVGVILGVILRFYERLSEKNRVKSNGKPLSINDDITRTFKSFYVAEDGTIVRKNTNDSNNIDNKVKNKSLEQKEALSLIVESAESGVAEAQYYLGLCYEQGSVIKRDIELAKKWYRLSAAQNYPQAKFRLGKLLMEDK